MIPKFPDTKEGREKKSKSHVYYYCTVCGKLTDSPLYSNQTGIVLKEWRCRNCGAAQPAAE